MTKVLRTATRLLLHLTHFVTMFNDVFLVEMNCLKSLFLDIYLQIRFSRMNYSYNNILLWLCPLPISFFFFLGHVNIFFKYFLTANMKYMKYMSVGTTTLISYNIQLQLYETFIARKTDLQFLYRCLYKVHDFMPIKSTKQLK